MAEGKKKSLIIIGAVLAVLGLVSFGIGVYNNITADANVAMAASNIPVERPKPFPQIGGALSLIAGVIMMALGAKKD